MRKKSQRRRWRYYACVLGGALAGFGVAVCLLSASGNENMEVIAPTTVEETMAQTETTAKNTEELAYPMDALTELDRLFALFQEMEYPKDCQPDVVPSHVWSPLRHTLRALKEINHEPCNGTLQTLKESRWLFDAEVVKKAGSTIVICMDNGDFLISAHNLRGDGDVVSNLITKAESLGKQPRTVRYDKQAPSPDYCVIADEPELYVELLELFAL